MITKLSEIDSGFFDRKQDLIAVIPTVKEIITDVRERGDAALRDYTRKFDSVSLDDIEVSEAEKEAAVASVDADMKLCIRTAFDAIWNFHYRQKRSSWIEEFAEGLYIGELYQPLEIVGAYVPAGYFSTVLMCVIPAKIAGVRDIIVCSPPRKDGNLDPGMLYAAELAGATRIYKVGGAQAIAALAFGTETVPRVDKIVGPGNVYVTVAKMLVREYVEIDFPAGPSEILIIADDSADPEFITADMSAQAEHGIKSRSVLVTHSPRLAEAVDRSISDEEGSEAQNWIILTSSIEESIEFANRYAPEHLAIMVNDPLKVLKHIKNAGSVFIGSYTPVAVGDYATGANHVLPTAGYARVYSGLDVAHFMHRITVQHLDRSALARMRHTVTKLSRAEGMEKHARSVEVRFS